MYPLKLHRSAMAPDTIVTHVAANVHWKKKKSYYIFVQFLVRDIKPPNYHSCLPPFCPRTFLSLYSWKRKQTFHWTKTEKKPLFGTIKSFFSFWTAKTEKIWWKKLGKQDWLFGGLMSWTRYKLGILMSLLGKTNLRLTSEKIYSGIAKHVFIFAT